MTLGPYKLTEAEDCRKQHVIPADTHTPPCGTETTDTALTTVSRSEFVKLDLQNGLCKRCLYSLGHINSPEATIAKRIN